MDEIIHLHLLLDRLRETQLRHSAMLTELLRRSKNTPPSIPDSTLQQKLLPLLRLIATNAGQWAGGVLAMAYALKGGDLLTGIQTLLKLFS